MVILVCRPCGECNWITMDDYREDHLTERVSYQTFVIGATEREAQSCTSVMREQRFKGGVHCADDLLITEGS